MFHYLLDVFPGEIQAFDRAAITQRAGWMDGRGMRGNVSVWSEFGS